jgi:hypothetical protein
MRPEPADRALLHPHRHPVRQPERIQHQLEVLRHQRPVRRTTTRDLLLLRHRPRTLVVNDVHGRPVLQQIRVVDLHPDLEALQLHHDQPLHRDHGRRIERRLGRPPPHALADVVVLLDRDGHLGEHLVDLHLHEFAGDHRLALIDGELRGARKDLVDR